VRLLSYSLGPATPTYRDNPKVQLMPVSLMEDGGVANWFELRTINHNGTHVDAPWHFDPDGPRLTEVDLELLVYWHPVLVDVPVAGGELIGEEMLRRHEGRIADADMLLVRTGFGSATRSRDPICYGWEAPGFEVSAAYYLRAFPALRALVMDLPSATAPRHLRTGHEFHQVILRAAPPGTYVLLVEDARLDEDLSQEELHRVTMAPLMLEGADGAPVTLLAE